MGVVLLMYSVLPLPTHYISKLNKHIFIELYGETASRAKKEETSRKEARKTGETGT